MRSIGMKIILIVTVILLVSTFLNLSFFAKKTSSSVRWR